MSRPKVIISTDLGGGDNDDAQSMIHALLYANEVDYRGFVMTRTYDNGIIAGQRTDGAEWLREMLGAYAADLTNLRSHDSAYPSADALGALIRTGSTDSSFPGTLSAGAQLIIDQARATTAGDPVYVLTWGPIHDVAAALLAAPDIVSKIRLFSLSGLGQDTKHPAAYNALVDKVANDPAYHDLWWINSENTMRGMFVSASGNPYQGIAEGLPWIAANAPGHGNLGELFWDKYTYNISNGKDPSISPDGLKMGDTPSLLYLLDTADNDDPLASSWGGRFIKTDLGTQTWTDNPDPSVKMGVFFGARTVYEHRDEVRGDFADRFDWAATRAYDGATLGVGHNEAENLTRSGYYVSSKSLPGQSGSFIETSLKPGTHTGHAEGQFTGASGDYLVTVRYFNENDGVSTYSLSADDHLLFNWDGKGGNNSFTTIAQSVHIDHGEILELVGTKNAGECARVDYIDIAPSASAAAIADDFQFFF